MKEARALGQRSGKDWWTLAAMMALTVGFASMAPVPALAGDAEVKQSGTGKAAAAGPAAANRKFESVQAGMVCLAPGVEPVPVSPAGPAGEYRDAEGQLYHASELFLWPGNTVGRADMSANPERQNPAHLYAYPSGPADRWHSIPAYVVRHTDMGARLVQSQLLETGHAVFLPKWSAGSCAEALRGAELQARQASAGLWDRADQVPLHSAATVKSLLGDAGNYAIVRGRVVSLGKTRSTRYLNFGGYWKEDFTVTLAAADADTVLAGLARAGWSFEDLDGRAVEIRGVIEVRDGPLISWRHPEQLVVLEEKRVGRDGQNQD